MVLPGFQETNINTSLPCLLSVLAILGKKTPQAEPLRFVANIFRPRLVGREVNCAIGGLHLRRSERFNCREQNCKLEANFEELAGVFSEPKKRDHLEMFGESCQIGSKSNHPRFVSVLQICASSFPSDNFAASASFGAFHCPSSAAGTRTKNLEKQCVVSCKDTVSGSLHLPFLWPS